MSFDNINVLQNIINCMGHGLIVTNVVGEFKVFNNSATKILNQDAVKSTPEQWSKVYGLHSTTTGEMLSYEELPLYRALQGETVDNFQIFLKHKEHPNQNINVSSTPLLDNNQRQLGAIAIFNVSNSPSAIPAYNIDLLDLAREHGRYEVASEMVDKTGNILSSMLGSFNVVNDYFNQPIHKEAENLFKAMMMENYDSNEERVVWMKSYLQWINLKQEQLKRNINEAQQNLNRINCVLTKNIQNTKLINLCANFPYSDLIEQMMAVTNEFHDIDTEYNICYEGILHSDKNKLFKVLTHLISNAKASVEISKNPKKLIHITLCQSKSPDYESEIRILDNGIGIDIGNLDKIFNFGFTTKNAPGFGLYDSFISAQQLGCKVEAKSGGTNQGAEFILYIKPVTN